ncbi:SpvB/TcaC N-terminal domain-containing protein, partial [Pseudomonas sp. SIMBA_044]|uniref:SpvB/TcaC N-terminal domain-containing protein n=1 Tax=Pseudomonas sp. SIMBA_044 TaxID=3085785 RepID=UPI0039780A98
WLLQESLSPYGEHIYYHYKNETLISGPSPLRDFRAQRYLARVCYGNLKPLEHLMLWNVEAADDKQWHFELVLDYGERAT